MNRLCEKLTEKVPFQAVQGVRGQQCTLSKFTNFNFLFKFSYLYITDFLIVFSRVYENLFYFLKWQRVAGLRIIVHRKFQYIMDMCKNWCYKAYYVMAFKCLVWYSGAPSWYSIQCTTMVSLNSDAFSSARLRANNFSHEQPSIKMLIYNLKCCWSCAHSLFVLIWSDASHPSFFWNNKNSALVHARAKV